jgi:formate dehydrogenase beta subunit
VTERPAFGMNLISQKMGLSEWSYHNDYNPAHRQKMQHVDLVRRFKELDIEVELGFTPNRRRAKCSAA